MELRHLEYFVAVAEERSFTRAAARLHVVQSAVSAAIKTLERELRTEILRRTSREVALTEAGTVLLPRARTILDSVRETIDAIDGVRGTIGGEIRLGLMASVPWLDLPAVLGRMHAEHPEVRLRSSHRAGGSQELAAAVVAGELDLAILSDPGPFGRKLRLTELRSFPMRLLVPATHSLAERRSARLEELEGETFVDLPQGFGSRAVVDRAFAAADLTRSVSIEVGDGSVVADYVRQGLGIAIVPEAYARADSIVRSLALTASSGLTWRMCLAAPRDRELGTAAKVLTTMVLDALEK
ncbi:LysR family transcriptional regulator [Nocardia colli]|uniref:LysR family transcriptional regulator n=1 Tax=Nocardia colli TaxID=2545717 RepID=A0A5N0EB07_9NOCA|nr:LysR family transcriptional regulator [Nocardia colli]KAA8885364.1 LysR family transcriptional regulator [Nocardia colli]